MRIHHQLSMLLFGLCICLAPSIASQNLEKSINTYISDQYTADTPGISILVAKDGKIIYMNGFGMSNLELSVKTNPKHVFEIGSITKQFTAVAILMLEEQGKLKITDDITKYIADYPTYGKTITIHNLLNHTSGIKSYTDVPSFISLARTDMTPTELIDTFKNLPMDFDPDTEFRYNNSGYILLGHIIEVVSGQSYADFIKTHIFDKIDMKNSYYGSMLELIPNRASGYSETASGFRNADYLSLTLPYAAGSIMSTTEDLLKWQNALSANILIKKTSLDKAVNGSKLASGETISYGYGFTKGTINGSKTIEHSGGIFGYSSNGIFLPEENVYVIGLTNCDCGSVGAITTNIAAMAIGKPFPKKEDAITLNTEQLSQWLGAYEFDNNIIRHITIKDNQLFSQREGSTNLKIYPMTASNFIFDGGSTSYDFYFENEQRMVKMTTNGNTSIGRGIDKAPPSERKEIQLSNEILTEYIGKYEIQPMFHISISVRDNKTYAIATGQGEVEIFANEKDKFFLKVVPAEILFNRSTEGKIESLTLNQGGQQMLGKKIE
ncbi:serine hydrolase [Winogradskyella psychrotolerans]|uniref:serine hydrolase n=1 Tax=Winogradskyella psychrotolerans TaxID=1344585 RepID=UPI001C06E7A5|nr:serine hydrolase [Winogradskyella psychrotolerans]MBU2928525.1 serine hydrolase [Winogradskyella psychrotolerans]